MTAEYFWDRHAPKFAKKPIADPTAYAEKLSRVLFLLRATDRVLEIGCGTGGTALQIAPGVAHVTATDISGEMIRIATSKLGTSAKDTVEFLQADAADEVEGHPFDAICAFSLLHLVEDVPAVLDRVRRQLKPGGLFLSKTVCLKDRSRLVRAMVGALAGLGLAPHVTALSRTDLITHQLDAGFEIEQTTYLDRGRMSPFVVARRVGH